MTKINKPFGSVLFSGSHMITLAKRLRRNETKAEEILRQELRTKKLRNLKFRRQHPIGNYIADFYCSEKGLVIELDGGIHNAKEQKELDKIRDESLKGYGITTLRFKNQEVFNDINRVLQEILRYR